LDTDAARAASAAGGSGGRRRSAAPHGRAPGLRLATQD
jgi:hypothetical protein